MSETFSLQTSISPDYSIESNWSGGMVPGLGTVAVIDNATVLVDPTTVLSAQILLQGIATLAGNGGGFSLGAGSALDISGQNALYADGAVVSDAGITVTGDHTSLRIVIDDASGVAESYGLDIPSFENTGQISIGAGATLAVEGTELSNTGAITVDDATLAVTGGAVDGGQGADPLGGTITLSDDASASFSDGVAGQNIQIEGTASLDFLDPAGVAGDTVSGFDFSSSILTPSFAEGQDLLDNLTFADLPAHTAPFVIPVIGGGAEIILEPVPPCFARGTRLLTPSGYTPVEALGPGDPVVTFAGDVRPIRWTGCRSIDIAAHNRKEAVMPVRVLADALGPGVPAKHLRLSPDHGVLLRGRLVPVKLLVNGATILKERRCQAVTYYHVELDRHEILLSENLAVESYLDTGNRDMFETTAGEPRKNPAFGRGRQWDVHAYADLCLDGPVLRDIRRGIRARALELGYRPRTLTDVSLWSNGRKYPPAGGTASRPVFRIATLHSGQVGIRSPVFVPAETSNGDSDQDDNRLLGIAIARIRFGIKNMPASKIAVSGFYPRGAADEADWTDGNAVIEVPRHVSAISLKLAALPQGWTPPPGAVALDI